MANPSLYSIKAITSYMRDWSNYLPSRIFPFLPVGLTNGKYCCVSYFQSYFLKNSNRSSEVDPGLFRDQRQLSMPDGEFAYCGPDNYPKLGGDNHIADYGANILVYPGCKVKLNISGKAFYVKSYTNVSSNLGPFSNGEPYSSSFSYNGNVQFRGSVLEYPQPYTYTSAGGAEVAVTPFCCPPDCSEPTASTLTYASSDGLNWKHIPKPYFVVYTRDSAGNIFPEPSIDYDCAFNTYSSANEVFLPPTFYSYFQYCLYESCLNYLPSDMPVITCGDSGRHIKYDLIAVLPYTPTYYCCEGSLENRQPPNTFQYENKTYCNTGQSSLECCDQSLGPPAEPCPCYANSFENFCLGYTNINLDFIYENKTDCVAIFGVDFSNYYNRYPHDTCEGSDLVVDVEVLSGGCGN